MTLRDFILTYEENGVIKANLFDYYDIFIKPLDKSFEPYSDYNQNLVLCYFKDHDDVNPSMGWIKHKYLRNVKVCHCFGCGKTADIVRIHQILSSQYLNKTLTEREACLELADMFSIPLDDFEADSEDPELNYRRNLRKIDRLKNRYTIREFTQAIQPLRGGIDTDLDRLNSECVKMIATVKQLYD